MLPRARLLNLLATNDRVLSDLQSAYDYLLTVSTVNPNAIGMIGLGTGGGAALRYAARNSQVGAVVDAYGDVLHSPDELGEMRGPVLGLFAGRDSGVRESQVDQFGALLDDAGIENDLNLIDHLSPGFFRFPEITVIGSSPYNAWQEVVAFLAAHLT